MAPCTSDRGWPSSRIGGVPGAVGRVTGADAALLGLPLSGFTAVLRTNTAVAVTAFPVGPRWPQAC